MRAAAASRCASASTRDLSSSIESGTLASSKAVATKATGSAGTTAPTFAISTSARRSTSAKRAA